MTSTRICMIAGCNRIHVGRGFCNMHLRRWVRTGRAGEAETRKTDTARLTDLSLYSRVIDTGCWQWTGYINKDGYAHMAYLGRQGVPAHRVAWVLANGPIPDGMTVDHVCFNPGCVNAKHLQLLTRSANSRRKKMIKTCCVHGHEFTDENTYLDKSNRGRRCRACGRERSAAYKARLAMQVPA
jgi:hypothetical protein